MRFDQSNSLWRSSIGTPMRSAIACNGSSAAMSTTKSHSPRSITLSTIVLARRTIVSLSLLIIRGVNPLLTSSRYRVCLVGSMYSIIIPRPDCSSVQSGMLVPWAELKLSHSRLIIWTSAYFTTDQKPLPSGSSHQTTGVSRRRRAKVSWGTDSTYWSGS